MINKYEIYSVKVNDNTKKFAFMDWSYAENHGWEFTKDTYTSPYSYTEHIQFDSHIELLDFLWEKYNLDCPRDFKRHSLSVSDIIKLIDDNGNETWYYIDGIGYKDITEEILLEEF